jgi:hypothetical protein
VVLLFSRCISVALLTFDLAMYVPVATARGSFSFFASFCWSDSREFSVFLESAQFPDPQAGVWVVSVPVFLVFVFVFVFCTLRGRLYWVVLLLVAAVCFNDVVLYVICGRFSCFDGCMHVAQPGSRPDELFRGSCCRGCRHPCELSVSSASASAE